MGKDADLGWRLKISDALAREASYIMTGQRQVRGISLGKGVTFSEKAGEALKAIIPFSKGKLRPDFIVFNKLPITTGVMHVVHSYSGDVIFPVEFVFTRVGRIPHAVCLKRGGILVGGRWVSASVEEGRGADRFCDHLADRGLKQAVKWDLRVGSRLKIPLQWAIQLIPLKGNRYAMILRVPRSEGLFGGFKHNVRSVLALADKIDQAVQAFGYQGQSGSSQPLVQSFAALAVSGLGEQDVYMSVVRPESLSESNVAVGADVKAGAANVGVRQASGEIASRPKPGPPGVEEKKSFVGKALLALVLYYLGCFVGGLATNVFFLMQASQESRATKQPVTGRGCLVALLAAHIGLACLLLLLVVLHVVLEWQ